ncbi:PIG-L deacetylase family protein [Candidatus Latescibacterota bacterium]
MERRMFIGSTAIGGALLGSIVGTKSASAFQPSGYNVDTISEYTTFADNLEVEPELSGQPHRGKVLAAIQAHVDDIPLMGAGLVAKLIKEGYTGYLIRTTNEDTSGRGTVGQGTVGNETDNQEVARVLGLKKVYDLNYRKHRLDGDSQLELRARLIFLFRLLQVDTVISFDPFEHNENNPDHTFTAIAVDAASWHAGQRKDFPEQIKLGLKPHSVSEKYYYRNNIPAYHMVNRIVDISSVIDKKVESILVGYNLGPGGNNGARLKARLEKENKKLPILGDDDDTANFQYIKQILMTDWKKLGEQYGLEYAEAFHYIGPYSEYHPNLQDYIDNNAVPIKS